MFSPLRRFPRAALVLALSLTATGCATEPGTMMAGSDPNASASPFHEQDGGLRRLRAGIENGRPVTMAIAGDSTGAMTISWPYRWLTTMQHGKPSMSSAFYYWDDKADDWFQPGHETATTVPRRRRTPRASATPTPEEILQGLTIWNGSIVGSRLDYHLEHLEQLYPSARKIDVLVISMGHNYQLQTAEQFTKSIDDFLAAYQRKHPESKIVISSQNPQFLPLKPTDAEAHAFRQDSLRGYAAGKGYDYVDVYERWNALPDRGRDYVANDGVHPLVVTPGEDPTPARGTSKADEVHNGTVFWAQTFANAVAKA